MLKQQKEKRKQDLGIFYTRQEVVDFIFDILNIWKEKEDERNKRWLKHQPPHYPSIIDPAVGEGVFLKTAIEKEFTKRQFVFGIDIDQEVVKKWPEINLLKTFDQDINELKAHFFHQNGLDQLDWYDHKKHYQQYLKRADIKNQQFDCVVGNPPYGGVGLKEEDLTDSLIDSLVHFELLPKDVKKNVELAKSLAGGLFHEEKKNALGIKELKRLNSFPIEILFLEKFIQLTKPSGSIAIIIPDGILTNSNLHYVREFLSKKVKVEAIISLPRDTFKIAGTNAKTSILFLRKFKLYEKIDRNYPVFLSSIKNINKDNFQIMVNIYYKFYNKNMDKSQLVDITKDQNDRELIMVRIDKTLKQLMEEKPSSRWNSEYWHPKYDKLTLIMSKNQLNRLNDFKVILTSGYRGTLNYTKSGIPALKVRNVLDTGVDLVDIDYVPQDSPANTKIKIAKYRDLIINRSGTGSIGRMTIFLSEDHKVIITGDVYLLRLEGINPFYVNIFLKTLFGKMQIHRFESGVSGQTKIDLDEILNIYIPNLSIDLQNKIEEKHKVFSGFHNEAMEAKRNRNDRSYRENLETAKKMLRDLITKTEELIRGERDDIN